MFGKISRWMTEAVGTPQATTIAFAIIFLWAITGPLFGFSDTWQLVINTTTTIITFLMVFIIQRTQNQTERAINKKLDELIHSIEEADDGLAGIENEDSSD